ncbi:MAG: GyrI-like domain-containing protein [Chloroflexota bacterium]|nr:MAG: GyrI-like domain-containing protein [Chloroflexota bacterium]
MSELPVRIVKLEPMTIASTYGFGEQPEIEAWEKLLSWAREKGLNLKDHRFFGFNNPNPSPGSPNYGYEQWITVKKDEKPAEGIEIKEFSGGLYAVTRCEGLQHITEIWKQLAIWREESKYLEAPHQWLEECFTPEATRIEDYVFDLYAPIAE